MLEHPAGFSQTSMQTFGSTQATVSEKYTESNQFFRILKVYEIMEDVVKYYTIDMMTVQHNALASTCQNVLSIHRKILRAIVLLNMPLASLLFRYTCITWK